MAARAPTNEFGGGNQAAAARHRAGRPANHCGPMSLYARLVRATVSSANGHNLAPAGSKYRITIVLCG